MRRRVGQLRRQVHAGRVRVQRAGRAIADRSRLSSTRHRFDGSRRTPSDIRVLAGALAVSTAVPPPVRPVRFVGRGLTVVNLAVQMVLYGHLIGLDGSHPHPAELLLALLLATCSTASQLLLSLDVGRRLRPAAAEWPAPDPPVPAVVGACLLALAIGLSSAAAYALAGRLASGPVAAAAGLLLAFSAVAAPLMIIADEVFGPGPDGRLLRRAERILTRHDRRCRRYQRRTGRHLDAAERTLWRAERTLATLLDDLGARHPSAVALAGSVADLRLELLAARCANADADDPIWPDDVDLAG